MRNKVNVPNRAPSRGCYLAAVCGDVPGVLLQDDQGHQLYVTPKMARTLAGQLPEIAGIATGEVEPDLKKGLLIKATVDTIM